MTPIAPFGWTNNSGLPLSAADLEAMLAQAGAYTDTLATNIENGSALPSSVGSGTPANQAIFVGNGTSWATLPIGTAGATMLMVRSDGTLQYIKTPKIYASAWGVVNDGVTLNDTAINSAIAAAAALPAGGGCIDWGAGEIAISTQIVIPAGVSTDGGGSGTQSSNGTSIVSAGTTFVCTNAASGIQIDSPQGGYHRGWVVDGRGVGTGGSEGAILEILNGTSTNFMDVSAFRGALDNTHIKSTQNTTFIGCANVRAARDNVVIDLGAGGLVFQRCERYGAGRTNLRIQQSGTSSSVYSTPSDLLFLGGGLDEHNQGTYVGTPVTATTNSTTTLAAIGSFTDILEGTYISGAAIVAGTYICSINRAAGTAVMSQAATASASGVTITPTYFPPVVVAEGATNNQSIWFGPRHTMGQGDTTATATPVLWVGAAGRVVLGGVDFYTTGAFSIPAYVVAASGTGLATTGINYFSAGPAAAIDDSSGATVRVSPGSLDLGTGVVPLTSTTTNYGDSSVYTLVYAPQIVQRGAASNTVLASLLAGDVGQRARLLADGTLEFNYGGSGYSFGAKVFPESDGTVGISPAPTITGLPGSAISLRIAGANPGPPSSGAHVANDLVLDTVAPRLLVTTAAGTPGTFVDVAAYAAGQASVAAAAVLPVVTGKGLYFQAQYSISTSVTLANGTLRLSPVYVPIACTIEQMFAEFTAAGDAPSVLALCIYTDNGSYYPGTLLLTGPTISTGSGNAGTVSTGGTPGMYGGSCSQALTPGWYWMGGVIQGVTVTQPTIRTGIWGPFAVGTTTLPGTNDNDIGYDQGSVTGALPGTFQSTRGRSSATPRIGVQIT